MSNHDASYLLNEVLHTMEEYQMLQNLSREDRYAFLESITRLAVVNFDCNAEEILYGLGEYYKHRSDFFDSPLKLSEDFEMERDMLPVMIQ